MQPAALKILVSDHIFMRLDDLCSLHSSLFTGLLLYNKEEEILYKNDSYASYYRIFKKKH